MTEEDGLQITIADWLRLQEPTLPWCHIPNGGSRNKIEAGKLKRMGVRRGMLDLFLPLPVFHKTTHRTYHGFWCELKTGKNKLTPDQGSVMHALRELAYYVCECRSFEDFVQEWTWYKSGEELKD